MANARLNKNARAWVRALRSGKYKQGRNFLTEVNQKTGEIVGDCCLGVVCKLAVKAGVIPAPEISDGFEYDGERKTLPASVQEWIGLKDRVGSFNVGHDCLSAFNDNGKSFKQIARIIEQKAKELFV